MNAHRSHALEELQDSRQNTSALKAMDGPYSTPITLRIALSAISQS